MQVWKRAAAAGVGAWIMEVWSPAVGMAIWRYGALEARQVYRYGGMELWRRAASVSIYWRSRGLDVWRRVAGLGTWRY